MKSNLFIRQLGEYFETFLPEIRTTSKNTIAAYGDSFSVFFQFLQDKKNMSHNLVTYKTFTPALFDEYLLWMKNERNYSPSSIKQRMTALSAFLKYASRREMSAINAYSAAIGTETPTVVRKEFPYFTLEEMKILLRLPEPNNYLGNRDLVFLSFLYETGARAQEICDVKVGDIRFSSTTRVRLHGKGNKDREVPISDGVVQLLKYHLKNTNAGKDTPLFLSQTNEKMTPACVRSIVAKYVTRAKAENTALFHEKGYSPHSFRHSKAVHMVESGVALIYIRNFLGHSTITSTEVYARIGQSVVTKALTNRKIPQLTADVPESEETKYSLPNFIKDTRKNYVRRF